MHSRQNTSAKTIDELIARAEMERMARLFLKRRNRGRSPSTHIASQP